MKEEVMSKPFSKTSSLFLLLKFFGFAAIFYCMFNAKVLGSVSPCFFGLFLSLMFLQKRPLYLSLSYMSALFLFDVTTNSIVSGLVFCIGAGLISYVYRQRDKRMPLLMSCLYAFILSLPYLYFNFNSLSNLYIAILNVFLNIVFMLCCYNFLKILKTRNFNLNLNIDEAVCGCLILSCLFCALQNLNIFNFDFVKLAGIAIVLFSVSVLPNSFSVVIAIVMGLGVSFCNGQLSYITLFSVIAIFCFIFKNYSKVYSIIMTLLVDLSFNMFLNVFGNFEIISLWPTLIACLIYFFIPQKWLNEIKNRLFLKTENDSLKNILNQNKLQISKRLSYTAEVFYEMDKNFRKLVKGNLDIKDAKIMIVTELIRINCENCAQKTKCLKGFGSELKKIFEQLVNVGFEKGKITLVDLPQYLTNRCSRLNQLVNSLNSILTEYKKYSKMLGNLDASKLLIAEQLGGVSHILNDLSRETKQTVLMDYKTEKLIKENLIYNDIVPSEVVCFEKDEKTNVVSMIVRSIDFDNEKIIKILNAICNSKMVLDEILPNAESNLMYLSYKTASVYDIAVGIAQTKKGGQEICGDTHALSKLNNDKFMLAISDGMGNGEKAKKASELSINMIENFYRAGFDSQTIMTSVNKLLNLGREDVFSALDISVVDLKSGEVDFIKQGATIGFIKKGNTLCEIESNSLPLGILDEALPKVTKSVLSPDDTVIMMSDGIIDAFGEIENLKNYLKNILSSNPQDVADKILDQAMKEQKNYPNDDMTVLVGRLFYNYV